MGEKELEEEIKGFGSIDEWSEIESRKGGEKWKMEEEMEVFKMEMGYIDWLENGGGRRGEKKEDEKGKEMGIEVVKGKNGGEVYFNSVGKEEKSWVMRGILDESVKVRDGRGVGIGVVDDIMINDGVLSKGS